ncbi:AraC-type DNA-binding protein [Flaviramulus basaltis]|uniref:AraC-type DNA-binding protein n=2 Tax=Flaviramulus basaltis TaxID=369401 RepID=A0A1K2ICT5_9FLAO|nr:AraC-type DNA-binding protein [Flaviramulus basaltis]
MLLEMASGNFFYRLERTDKNDNLESISISLNMLAEEIQGILLHQGYANSNNLMVEIIQMSFILDDKGYIDMVTQQSCNILSLSHSELIGLPITSILDNPSKMTWEAIYRLQKDNIFFSSSAMLTFKTQGSLAIPKACYITTFTDKNKAQTKTLVSAIHHASNDTMMDQELKTHIQGLSKTQSLSTKTLPKAETKQKPKLSFDDIRKIRKGHETILNNLEKDLPSLKEFALQLGTNEFKLKYGFRELYGTSVFKFLLDERLRKSKMMIQYSDQALKTIAHKTGFKSMPHFSRAFKKRFGYAPSELRKKLSKTD